MLDRNISRKLKERIMYSCEVPASTYGLDSDSLHVWQIDIKR